MALRRDLHDAAFSGERGSDVQVSVDVKCQPLRASQSSIKLVTVPLGSILVDAVVGSGHEQISLRAESQVVGGDARFEGGEDEHLLVGTILKMVPLRSPT